MTRVPKNLCFASALLIVGVLVVQSPLAAAEEEGFFGFKLAPEDRGVRITYIFEGEAADRGGLRVNDLILAVGETSFAGRAHDDLHELLEPYRSGQRVPVEVFRGDEVFTAELLLGPKPPELRRDPAARERMHEALAVHRALTQLNRLVNGASTLWIRRATGEGFEIRADDEEWEPLEEKGVEILIDKDHEDAVSGLEVSELLRLRLEHNERGARVVDVDTLPASGESRRE
jgi:PDZ domain